MVKPSGGRRFSKTCLVKGLEAEGRKAIIKRGSKRTRVAPIRADGLTDNGAVVVPNARILDLRPTEEPTAPSGPRSGIVGERGVIVLPADLRRRCALEAGSPYLIEERDEGILIQPAEIRPRRVGPEVTLSALLEDITPQSLHPEVDTGPSVGREAW
jgi:antitoxin component of MazEF toxin-antitoxin module